MNADKMFEELGYKIVINSESVIKYEDVENEDLNIVFNKDYKVIYGYPTYDYFCDMPILKAINKKCLELGWLGA